MVAAHKLGKIAVAQASSVAAIDLAIRAGVDVITHAPLERSLDAATVSRILERNIVVIPTLAMMEGIAERAGSGQDYSASRDSVSALYKAGVPLLPGTDANATPGVPAAVRHGDSIYHELELLVGAGLSELDVLRSATVLTAQHFGLGDRGIVAPGYRADLNLIDGDPLAGVTCTRRIRQIWCGGINRAPAQPRRTSAPWR